MSTSNYPSNTTTTPNTYNPHIPKPIPASSLPTNHKVNTSKIFHIILKSILTIFIVGCIYIVYYSYTHYKSTMSKAKEIANNWPEYRCRPSVMPFASQLTGGKVNTITNGIDCLITTYIKPYLMAFISPFIEFFEKILDVIVDLVDSIQNIRKMFNYMRESIHTFLLDIANMFYAYAKKISYMLNRIMDTFYKIFRVFQDIYSALGYSIYTLQSMWNGPIGGVARFFCFHKNTLITMKDNSQKVISKIKIGDRIKKGGKVLAVHTFSGKNIELYLYKNKIIVASSHLVYEDNKWVRIKKSKNATPIDLKEDSIYCLTTQKGKIIINDTIFSDYMEVQNKLQMTDIMNIIMEHLNQKPSLLKNNNDKIWGFSKDSLIKTKLRFTKIKYLRIGDNLGDGNIVEGITKIYAKNTKLYEFNKTICSGNVIVKKDNRWELIKNIGKPIDKRLSVLYHIFTTKRTCNINNNTYRDCESVKDNKIQYQIDKYVTDILNCNK